VLLLLQLAELKANSRQAPVSAGTMPPSRQDANGDDVVSLRQRVAELEQSIQESKTAVNAAANSTETGLFSLLASLKLSVLAHNVTIICFC